MKKVMMFSVLGFFTLLLSSYSSTEFIPSNTEITQVNCLDLADSVYDRMLLQEQYYIASAAADTAYDSCVEEGGYPGDSVVTIN